MPKTLRHVLSLPYAQQSTCRMQTGYQSGQTESEGVLGLNRLLYQEQEREKERRT